MRFVHFLFALAELQKKRGRAVGVVEMCEVFDIKRGTANMYLKQLMKSEYVVRQRRGKYMINSTDVTRNLGLLIVTPMDVYVESSRMQENRGV